MLNQYYTDTGIEFDSVLYLQIGPGIVYLTFHSPIGSGTFVQHLIPTEPLVQKLVHNLYYQKSYPAFIAKFFLLGEAIQVCNLTFIAFAFFMYLPFCRYLNSYFNNQMHYNVIKHILWDAERIYDLKSDL